MSSWAAQSFTASSTLTLGTLNRVWALSWDGAVDRPDLGVAVPAVFSKLQTLLMPQERYTTDSDDQARKAGFISLIYNGTPIYADKHCGGSGYGTADNNLYLLQTKYLDIAIHPDRNFKVDEPIRPSNQDARIWPILWAGLLGCNRRERQTRWSTINPSL